jgi:hypothetical protein
MKLPVTRFTQTHKEDAEGAQGGQPVALYLAPSTPAGEGLH